MAQKSGAGEQLRAKELITLCHDLRQFVSAGLLLSQMPGDDALDDALRKRLEMIHQQFRHSADLIGRAAGDANPRKTRLDLLELIEECVGVVRLTRNVLVEVEVTGRAEAYGDPVLLQRALANLLDNASRAVSENGHVVVRAGENDAEAWIEVADDGRGFGQIEAGSGHGLSIVNDAVRASRGRLQISSGPGPGTTVRLVLPIPHHSKKAS